MPPYYRSMTWYLLSQPPHGHNTRFSPYVTLTKPSSSLNHLSLLPTCFTLSLEPVASYTSLKIPRPNYLPLSIFGRTIKY